jgi:glycosyltransferase involved in cell wall biosynthesis
VKITVAMPAFNAAEYVEDAAASVLNQRCSSFELVIIDDRSTDRTWRRLRRFAEHPNVRLYRNAQRRGAAATRNRIVSLARGEYFVPCDADDLMLPGALARLSRYLDHHPRVGVVYGDVVEMLTSDDIVVQPPRIVGADHRGTWDVLDNVVNHAGSMTRRRLIQQVGGYDESVHSVDDWSLWLKLAEVCRFQYLAGELFYVWRRHPRSMTKTDPNWSRDVVRIRLEALRRRYGYRAG